MHGATGADKPAAVDLFDGTGRRGRHLERVRLAAVGEIERSEGEFRLHRLIPGQPRASSTGQFVDRFVTPVVGALLDGAALQMQEPGPPG